MTLTAERPPFSQVPHWLWTIDLEHAAVRVYGILMMHADNDSRQAFPGIRRIADEGRMSTSTVQRSLDALERLGAIIVTRTLEEGSNERAVNHYHLPWLQFGPVVATIATEKGGGVAMIDTPGVATIATELEPVLTRGSARRFQKPKPPKGPEPEPEFRAWALDRCARRKGGPGLLQKILSEDRDLWLAEKAEPDPASWSTSPSPTRNDPADCPHLAIDTDNWCAACMTEVPLVGAKR